MLGMFAVDEMMEGLYCVFASVRLYPDAMARISCVVRLPEGATLSGLTVKTIDREVRRLTTASSALLQGTPKVTSSTVFDLVPVDGRSQQRTDSPCN